MNPFFLFHAVVTALVIVSLFSTTACRNKGTSKTGERRETPLITFAAAEDVPFGLTPEEVDAEKAILRSQIEALNTDESLAFVVHVGDIKKGAPPRTGCVQVGGGNSPGKRSWWRSHVDPRPFLPLLR